MFLCVPSGNTLVLQVLVVGMVVPDGTNQFATRNNEILLRRGPHDEYPRSVPVPVPVPVRVPILGSNGFVTVG